MKSCGQNGRGTTRRLLLVALVALLGAPAAVLTMRAQAPQQPPPENTAPPVPSPTIPRGKKLFLKDGSFLIVRSYEVQQDRVRYYSTERSQWEEIPAANVDWDATHKGEEEEARQEKENLQKLHAAAQADLAAAVDVDASVEVGPGVFLPPGEGLYVLDGRAVLQLEQTEAQSKLSKGRLLAQVLVPVPVVPSRHTVFLPGAQAHFRINNPEPEFYIRTGDAREPEIQLIHAKVRGKTRQIEYLDALFTKQTSTPGTISLQRWTIAKGVYRLTLSQELPPGEYALAEVTPKEGMNLYVWDFGMDPPGTKTPSPKKN